MALEIAAKYPVSEAVYGDMEEGVPYRKRSWFFGASYNECNKKFKRLMFQMIMIYQLNNSKKSVMQPCLF